MKVSPCTLAILLSVASILPVIQAASADTNSAAAFSSDASSDLFAVLVRMVGALLFVIAVFLGGVWLFKRSRLFSLYQGGPAQLKILESRSLGYRSSLMVVGYGNQRFLVAVSATGVSLLTPLPDAETEEPLEKRPSFAVQLTRFQEEKTR